ncbi:MAG: gamma-glutamyltransferase [Turicibacter sp.]|nr:gamma-glutamyltransferase [Turicibacter sp.]
MNIVERKVVYAKNGCVATSQPLAAQAGLAIMRAGGNAVDAAVATAACLTVVEPTSNGIGSDAFALVWTKGKLHGLNSSGCSPKNISIEKAKAQGYDAMPVFGWTPVTVPGAPAAWAELVRKFGRLSLAEILKPAIDYAEQGFPISPVLGYFWERAFAAYSRLKGEEFEEWFKVFAPKGKAPKVGEMWRSQAHSDTLKEIAETDANSFYTGKLAEKIANSSQKAGGFLSLDDLANFSLDWVEPIDIEYRGYNVWEMPPNGQGIVALAALNILRGYDFPAREAAETTHLQIEALKQAFTASKQIVTDPKHTNQIHADWLLSEDFAKEARARIQKTAAAPIPFDLPASGTVYLCTADGDGNMVSYIQSNYMGFGSGVVIPDTGIAMQNRGHDFSLDPLHINSLQGGKRTYHTIIPAFLTKSGQPVGPFGVMGGYMQPQGHVQVVMNTIDFALNPQAALDAPRFQWMNNLTVEVEDFFPANIADQLTSRGHDIKTTASGGFGRGQIIWKDEQTGVLAAGTEPRTDGTAVGF